MTLTGTHRLRARAAEPVQIPPASSCLMKWTLGGRRPRPCRWPGPRRRPGAEGNGDVLIPQASSGCWSGVVVGGGPSRTRGGCRVARGYRAQEHE